MPYVNLTPHVLNMLDHGDIPPSGTIARVVEHHDGDIVRLGGVVGLPDPQPGVRYVVARPLAVAMALSGAAREDVWVVKEMVRDGEGRIVGARGFARIV